MTTPWADDLHAGAGRRAAGYAVDVALASVLLTPVAWVGSLLLYATLASSPLPGEDLSERGSTATVVVLGTLAVLAGGLVLARAVGVRAGGTPGQRLTDVVVVRDGRRPDLGRAVLRESHLLAGPGLMAVLVAVGVGGTWAFLLAGALQVLVAVTLLSLVGEQEEGRGPHDHLAGTHVLRRRESRATQDLDGEVTTSSGPPTPPLGLVLAAPERGDDQAGLRPADPLRRGVAVALDLGLAVLVAYGAARVLGALLPEPPSPGLLLVLLLPSPSVVLPGLVAFALRTVSESASGRSPGKALLGLRVVTATGGRPSRTSAAWRSSWLLVGLVGALPLLGPLLALVVVPVVLTGVAVSVATDPHGQGWHDRLGDDVTAVVRDDASAPPRGRPSA